MDIKKSKGGVKDELMRNRKTDQKEIGGISLIKNSSIITKTVHNSDSINSSLDY